MSPTEFDHTAVVAPTDRAHVELGDRRAGGRSRAARLRLGYLRSIAAKPSLASVFIRQPDLRSRHPVAGEAGESARSYPRIRYRIRGASASQIPSSAMNPRAQVIHLGELSVRLRQAARHLFETVLAPLGLFWLMLTLTNLTGGLVAALGWALGVLLCRLLTRSPIPAVLWLTTGLLVIRTAIGYATGSVFLYFLQPTLQNFVIAFVLLATLGLRRPLIARLADDFCAFPVALTSNVRVQRFFRRVSLLWALVFLTNGAATLWVLARATLGNFLMVTTAGSFSLVAVAAAVSLLWFRRELRGEGIRLRFGPAAAV
jgi:hypothetical protein